MPNFFLALSLSQCRSIAQTGDPKRLLCDYMQHSLLRLFSLAAALCHYKLTTNNKQEVSTCLRIYVVDLLDPNGKSDSY